MNKDGWKILLDTSGAEAIDDPSGATYAFVYVADVDILPTNEFGGF